ncbi:MAG: biosynthetic-type acetolactate synthase large subunit [Cyclobacteriaceae bacterium]|nr:biosynthetic-type acetolactate synthase large subunit [Cyclobacteriaceae bacterium]
MEIVAEKKPKNDERKAVRVSGAEALILSLEHEGVTTIFGYPGGAIMPVYDALFDHQENIHHILMRHEQGAVHAAQGFARASGRVGVVFATSGPGATNLITGIADAMIDSTPVVCITGNVFSPLLGTDAFQETDVVGISMPVTKWNHQVTSAEEIPDAIAKAFYIAKSGRPGPVLVDITKDAQVNEFDFSYKTCEGIRSYHPVPALDNDKLKEAADLINKAKRPFVLFGQGIILSHAENELKAFIEKTGIPAAWTLLGLSALPTNHPLNVGMLGMHGNYGPNFLSNESDVVIAVGMRFDDRVTGKVSEYLNNSKVIHMDIDPSEINKIIHADVPVLGDAKESLSALTALVNENSHEEWIQRFRDCDKKEHEKVIKNELFPTAGVLTMGEVIRIMSENAKSDAIIVTDVGQHQMVTSRYSKFVKSKSSITSGGLGTMGFCLPAAIGARFGAPERQVIGVIGDGGFQMTIQELGTIFQTDIELKILILNNHYLGMVRQWQQLFFDKRYSATEMVNPDFQTIARGYGIESKKIEKREDLESGIKEFLNFKGSYLLEVVVGKENNVFPMVPAGCSVAEIRLE